MNLSTSGPEVPKIEADWRIKSNMAKEERLTVMKALQYYSILRNKVIKQWRYHCKSLQSFWYEAINVLMWTSYKSVVIKQGNYLATFVLDSYELVD